MEETEFVVDEKVFYVPNHANGNLLHKDVETGTVTSMNKEYIFVRFGNAQHGAACNPKNLRKVRK